MRKLLLVLAVLLLAGTLASVARRERARAPIPVEDAKGPRFERGERALGAAVAVDPLRADAVYRKRFLDEFVSLTPENAMKWERLAPREGFYEFGPSDAIVDWAEAHGKRVRGHPLIWDQQIPDWVTRRGERMEETIRDHVTRIVRRYRGRVESWDVVNEPFDDDGRWTRNAFYEALGERYVDIAFEAARAADPDARLFLNEIAAEFPGPKQRALVRLARDLKGRGIPVDGIGLQNHTEAGENPSQRDLERVLGRFAGLGLDVEITEMDVVTPAAADDAEQAEAFAAAARACRAVERCTGLTVWGVTDATSWLGPDKRALLFDAGSRPKPALSALREAWGG